MPLLIASIEGLGACNTPGIRARLFSFQNALRTGFGLSSASMLALVMLSCTSQKPAPPSTTSALVKTLSPKDEQGNDLAIPEIVRAERVQNDNRGVKTITVGNSNGEYVLSCNMKAGACLTPVPVRAHSPVLSSALFSTAQGAFR